MKNLMAPTHMTRGGFPELPVSPRSIRNPRFSIERVMRSLR